eukprot:TRINITY_DN9666_c0_g2_i1.p1 TRINITY_DN9666_c0_g2~~TRINITY_DN9666_c0_g2_i1.p1  ORF type:complete len:193 (+),score=23.72 TRINITY_DN9666_c0_g2_i1:3-581(+)
MASEDLPLRTEWAFWHDKFIGPDASAEEYDASLKLLGIVNTVKKFWAFFNNIPTVDKLPIKTSVHLMKSGIKPLWEDPANAEGGFWALKVKPEDTPTIWRELLLAVIGEQFSKVISKEDSITGVTVSIRHHANIVQLWNKNSSAPTEPILEQVKKLIPKISIEKAFYKATKAHKSFSSEYSEKKKESSTTSI